MSLIKEADLKQSLIRDEKTATILNKGFQALLKNEKSIHEVDSLLGNNFHEIGNNETTPNLQTLFQDASNSMKMINETHQRYVKLSFFHSEFLH